MDIIINKLKAWSIKLIEMLPNFILALVILIAFIFLAKLLKKTVKNLLSRTYKNRELIGILSKIIQIVVIVAGAMIALSVLELDKTVTSVLAGAGIIGLALSFAFQDLAANLISGFYMAAKSPFQIGDVIEVNGYIGTVKEIQLRSTLIETFDGNEIRMPNRIIFENPMTNYYETKTRMVQLNIGVSYAEDLDFTERITIEAIQQLELVQSDDIKVIYKEFGDSSINLEVRYWVPYNTYFQYLQGVSEGIKAIKRHYDAHDIMIPFPITTVDFGIKGGSPLKDQLQVVKEEKS